MDLPGDLRALIALPHVEEVWLMPARKQPVTVWLAADGSRARWDGDGPGPEWARATVAQFAGWSAALAALPAGALQSVLGEHPVVALQAADGGVRVTPR